MRILVATVGTGRERRDIAAAICQSARENRADLVVCLCSPKTATETLPHIESGLAGGTAVRAIVHADHDDVQTLFGEYQRDLQTLIQEHPDAEVVVDFTSGTKPMSAAAFAVAIALRAQRVSYVAGTRDEEGRVVGNMVVSSFAPALVTAEDDLRLAAELFNARDYHAAAVLARRYTKTEFGSEDTHGPRARTLSLVAEAYELWERFEWNQAAHGLSGPAGLRSVLDAVLREKLVAQQHFLKKCAGDEWAPERVAELAANAARRIERGCHDDALARCYRGFEYLAQWRLAARHNIRDTARVPPGKIPEPLRTDMVRNPAAPTIALGLVQAYRLLAALKDELGQAFTRDYVGDGTWFEGHGPLAGGLTCRNQSWLAHGTTPAKREWAEGLGAKLHEYGERFVPDFAANSETAQPIRWPLPRCGPAEVG